MTTRWDHGVYGFGAWQLTAREGVSANNLRAIFNYRFRGMLVVSILTWSTTPLEHRRG